MALRKYFNIDFFSYNSCIKMHIIKGTILKNSLGTFLMVWTETKITGPVNY